jgi:hypothetical protein
MPAYQPADLHKLFRAATWQDVLSRDYRPWPAVTHVIDSAALTIDQAVAGLRVAALGA